MRWVSRTSRNTFSKDNVRRERARTALDNQPSSSTMNARGKNRGVKHEIAVEGWIFTPRSRLFTPGQELTKFNISLMHTAALHAK